MSDKWHSLTNGSFCRNSRDRQAPEIEKESTHHKHFALTLIKDESTSNFRNKNTELTIRHRFSEIFCSQQTVSLKLHIEPIRHAFPQHAFHRGTNKEQNKWMNDPVFTGLSHAVSVSGTRHIKTHEVPHSTRRKHRLYEAVLRVTSFLYIGHNYALFRTVRPSKSERVASPTDNVCITSEILL